MVTPSQKGAIEEVIQILCATHKGRRKVSEMFMELPSKEDWPEYYKVIPEPRCLEGIRSNVEKGKYKDPLLVYDDLMLVFANALHFNDQGSQIAKDATTLKAMLEETWKNNLNLPDPPPPSPPPSPPSTSEQHMKPRPVTSKSALYPSPVLHPAESSSSSIQPPSPKLIAPITSRLTMEDDGEMTPEPQDHDGESQGSEVVVRDEESSQIVKQLERGLPRWTGGDDRGWMENILNEDVASRCMTVLTLLKSYKTPRGLSPFKSLDEVREGNIKDASYDGPLSFTNIEDRVRANNYKTLQVFDKDLACLFERARRWHATGSEAYGSSLLLQRLYQLITSPPYPNAIPPTTTNFSSIAAGPGVARPVHSQATDTSHAVTTFRIPIKDRLFTDELIYKGMSFRVGDWVHLANPDDPAKPIIAQIFKTWIPEGDGSKKSQQSVTVCWYFRPEQTMHPGHRQFWENEIFKTGHFAEHNAEDILEKVACQFTARHIRGRPRPPYWYPGWPLYVCDSRYNDRERVFVKIKNWNSCIPEEYRKNDFMPIYPFERIIYPKRYPSPFLTGITGPGGIAESVERAEGEKIEGSGTGRKRSRRTATSYTDYAGPRYGTFVGTPVSIPTSNVSGDTPPQPTASQIPTAQTQQKRTEDRSINSVLGGLANLRNNATVEVLPPETVKHFDRDPDSNQLLWFSGPPVDLARTPIPRYSLKYLHYLTRTRTEHRGVDDDRMETEENVIGVKRRRMTDIVSEVLAGTMDDQREI